MACPVKTEIDKREADFLELLTNQSILRGNLTKFFNRDTFKYVLYFLVIKKLNQNLKHEMDQLYFIF